MGGERDGNPRMWVVGGGGGEMEILGCGKREGPRSQDVGGRKRWRSQYMGERKRWGSQEVGARKRWRSHDVGEREMEIPGCGKREGPRSQDVGDERDGDPMMWGEERDGDPRI